MRPLTLWARRYGLGVVAAAGSVQAVLGRILDQEVTVPGRTTEVAWVLWPLLPAFVAAAASPTALAGAEDLEIVTAMPVVRRRAAALLAVMAVSIVAALAAGGSSEAIVVHVRNGALLVGVVFALASVWTSRAIALVPPVAAAVTWLLGAPEPGQPVPWWALLLAPPEHRAAAWIAGATFAVGATSFLFAPQRVGDR